MYIVTEAYYIFCKGNQIQSSVKWVQAKNKSPKSSSCEIYVREAGFKTNWIMCSYVAVYLANSVTHDPMIVWHILEAKNV